jgi:hypothetical protein
MRSVFPHSLGLGAFEFLSTAKGADATTEPFARNAAGILELLIDNIIGAGTVGPGEIEITVVRMRVNDGSQSHSD